MACPECSKIQEEYLVFRKAFARFAENLNLLELERLRVRAELNPGLPSSTAFRPILLFDSQSLED